MSFLQELGKGFIRSAVNQVGRDGGKVISNHIYGDAHATPIRHVGQSTSGTYFDTETSQPLTPQQILQYATTDGWKPEYSAYKWSHRITLMFWAVLVGCIPFIFPLCLVIPIVPIYIIYRGIKHMTAKKTIYAKMVEVPKLIADRRYKGNIRQDGTELMKATIPLTSTPEDKAAHRRLGFSYILCAIFLWLAVYFCGSFIMQIEPKADDGIITEQITDTLNEQE